MGCGLLFSAFSNAPPPQPPHVEISNGVVKATLYLPDPDHGYYRGSRFDWSGVISRLEYKGHNYFGVWFEHYDPYLHDAITGPVEEFRNGSAPTGSALGYDEAPPGGMFVKIGVGVLKKPDGKPYSFARRYQIVNTGVWASRPEKDSIEFQQDLEDDSGYSYSYRKVVKLVARRPEMMLEHTLRNTGKRVIDTNVYDHDFYVLDGMPTGPPARIVFPFAPKPADEPNWPNASGMAGKAVINDKVITYTRELQSHEQAASLLTGFSSAVSRQ